MQQAWRGVGGCWQPTAAQAPTARSPAVRATSPRASPVRRSAPQGRTATCRRAHGASGTRSGAPAAPELIPLCGVRRTAPRACAPPPMALGTVVSFPDAGMGIPHSSASRPVSSIISTRIPETATQRQTLISFSWQRNTKTKKGDGERPPPQGPSMNEGRSQAACSVPSAALRHSPGRPLRSAPSPFAHGLAPPDPEAAPAVFAPSESLGACRRRPSCSPTSASSKSYGMEMKPDSHTASRASRSGSQGRAHAGRHAQDPTQR